MQSIRVLVVLLWATTTYAKHVWRYNMTITSAWGEKDGHGRPKYYMNGQSPGPLLTVREGDEMEVFVSNQLAIETTMHWHGVYQVDHPWNDGVPGVTQFSIQPRDNYTYRWTATGQYGSYFYHGHFGPAFADGMRGPIWIIPAESRERPYRLISDSKPDLLAMKKAEENPHHIVTSDWNAEGMDILLIQYRDTGFAPWCSNSLTLNDRGRTYCHSTRDIKDAMGPDRNSLGCIYQVPGYEFTNPLECEPTQAPLEVVQQQKDEDWVWINFIHSGAHHELSISIDEHDFFVIAADGEFVHPQKVHQINVNLGERISILVKMDKKAGDYAIRLHSLSVQQGIEGIGILRYHQHVGSADATNTTVPSTKPWVHLNGTLISGSSKRMEEMALAPFPLRPPPNHSDTTLKFIVKMTGPSTWVLHSSPHQGFRQSLPPLLWDSDSRGDTTYGSQGTMQNGSVVDIIFENDQGVTAMHPFHKHNMKAFIIGMGHGGFPFETVEEAMKHEHYRKDFNLIDPPLRDGCRLNGGHGAWTVIRYQITFPAASMLHCHRIHHFGSGQQVILLEGVESMAPVPEEVKNMVHADFIPPVRYGPLD
ncbi:related to laccase precursor [Ramularia collo-cygni]|uniref:Related to laccase n=1 Tax=Ramularia collo-cygni TaxID=112498 RepID=A0A2D3V262_9PEZI|nr:related to laccase precursor [Ramularia collo-cygni]CZT17606.1 related to laccase precursor [Ramularia collo-cygni]